MNQLTAEVARMGGSRPRSLMPSTASPRRDAGALGRAEAKSATRPDAGAPRHIEKKAIRRSPCSASPASDLTLSAMKLAVDLERTGDLPRTRRGASIPGRGDPPRTHERMGCLVSLCLRDVLDACSASEGDPRHRRSAPTTVDEHYNSLFRERLSTYDGRAWRTITVRHPPAVHGQEPRAQRPRISFKTIHYEITGELMGGIASLTPPRRRRRHGADRRALTRRP
jgi:hypothetical protein